jgi:Protein tyrosine and serine/threonine kinase
MPLFGRRKSASDAHKNSEEEARNVVFMIERVRRVSPLLLQQSPQTIPHFHSDEIVVGEILAQGEFNTLYAVQELQLPAITATTRNSISIDGSNSAATIHRLEEEEERRRICATQEGQLVVKMATPKRGKRKKPHIRQVHELAAATLVLEAQYLARLQHPNIIQLKGVTKVDDPTLFFFLTERIVETLAERIEFWRTQEPQGEIKLDTTCDLFQTKMKIANDIASALHYLQQKHRIALLNLSPDAIGFLQDGTVQLFDLGHCREMTPKKETQPETQRKPRDDEASISIHDISVMLGSSSSLEVPPPITPHHTAVEALDGTTQTGGHRKILPTAALGVVPRYLAPEILTTGEFDLKSDSYSFAVILYELFTLQKPYAAYQPGQHMIKVCIQGKRPNLHLYQFPKPLVNLVHRGWRHNGSKRISVSTMRQVLANSQFNRDNPSATSGGDRPPPPTTRGMPPATVSSQPRRGRRPQRNRSMLNRRESLTSRLSLKRNKSLMSSFRRPSRSKTPVPLARVNVNRDSVLTG